MKFIDTYTTRDGWKHSRIATLTTKGQSNTTRFIKALAAAILATTKNGSEVQCGDGVQEHWAKTAYPHFCYACLEQWWSFTRWASCKHCGSTNMTDGVKR